MPPDLTNNYNNPDLTDNPDTTPKDYIGWNITQF